MVDKFFSLFGAIVILAVVTTVVAHGSDSANILRAWGDTFSSSIRAGMGR